MKAVEKIKLSRERIELIAQLKNNELKGRDKILASKRIAEIVSLLTGGGVIATAEEPETTVDLSPFERIVRDSEITIETLQGAIESTKMLLNSTSTPKVFIDAVQVVSDKLSDGSLLDSLGAEGVALVAEFSGMLDGLDTESNAIRTLDLVHETLVTSNWIKGENGVYSNAEESFSIRLNDSRSSSFDVEIYQNQVCVNTLTTNGDFTAEILDFINEYIQLEANKLRLMEYAKDRIVSIGEALENIKPLEEIAIVDVVAQGASTSQANTGENPTQEQLIANDYKTAKVVISGMPIAIENPIGSVRRGRDEDGNEWETQMTAHYGYFENTLGADGDELDVFILPDTPHDYDGRVFVLAQIDKKGNFDEHKVILGATSKVIAMQVYRNHYDENFNGVRSVVELSVDNFKARAFNNATAMLDSIQKYMMDSWIDDGSYELLPLRKLDLSRLGDGSKEPKVTIKEPIVVYSQGAKNYVVQGRKRLDIATKSGEKFIPCIVFDADQGYTKDDIKTAFRKCGNIVHAEALGAMIEIVASGRAETELV